MGASSGVQGAALDTDMLKAELAMAPMEHAPAKPMRITLPRPEGGFESFDIVEYSMMEPGLAAAFPEIKTYYGQCVEEPAANAYLDWTPLGFHAQVLSPTGGHAIDTYSKGDTTYYSSYFFKDLKRADGFRCETLPDFVPVPEGGYAQRSTGTMLRTYRLAMAATASFCGYYGGASQAQAGVVTGVNRINQVYGNEFSIRLTLVANNQNLMFTDSATQPYTDGTLSTMLGQNQTTVNNVIGSGNYDVGHVVSRVELFGRPGPDPSGVHQQQGKGGTGALQPTGADFFWVEYTAHELGHEFGANHSFNSDDSADGDVCLPNRNASTAIEPGGGSTIMSIHEPVRAAQSAAEHLRSNVQPGCIRRDHRVHRIGFVLGEQRDGEHAADGQRRERPGDPGGDALCDDGDGGDRP